MPVALPPPLPPQQGEVFALRRAESHPVITVAGYRLHVLGPRLLDGERLRAAMDQVDSLSNAVRRLTLAHYAAGYPTAQLTYALDGQDLYVLVRTGRIIDARAPRELSPYFRGLEREAVLTDSVLEPRRLLASVHADRAGLDAGAALRPRGEGYLLDLTPVVAGPAQSAVKAELSNPGNRYVGRYFTDLALRHAWSTGDEVALSWRHGLPGLDDDTDTQRYDEEVLGFSRVTPFGLFGISGHRLDYRLEREAVETDGRLQQLELSWFTPIAASFRERWTVNLRLDYTDQTEDVGAAESVQQERYASLEGGGVYSTRLRDWELDAGLQLRRGLRDQTAGAAELDYLALRPRLRLQREFGGRWRGSLQAQGQWSGDTVPEQSQFLLGGLDNVTAWLPGVAVGDRGAVLQTALGYRETRFAPWSAGARVFAEYGVAASSEADGSPVELADAGVALSLAYRQTLELQLAAAAPLASRGIARAEREDAEAGLLFRVAATF